MIHRAATIIATFIFLLSLLPNSIARGADALDEKIERASKEAQSNDDDAHTRGMQTLEATVEELEKLEPAKEKPAEARRLFLLGKTYFYLDRQDDAGKYLDQALALAPGDGEYHYVRAQAHAMNADASAAEAQYIIATKLSPKQTRYWYGLGLCEAGGKKIDEAKAAFEHAVEADPKNARATLMVGAMLTQQGKRAEALKMFEKAAGIDPAYELAFSNIGQIQQTDGKPAEALAAYRSALKIKPDDGRMLAKAIQCEEALGQTKERDGDHSAIVKLHADGKMEDEFFCRDQFAVGKVRVMAFEYFELQGERPMRYSFDVLDESGQKAEYRISLGSSDADSQIAREQGQIGKDQRIYFLDADYPDGKHKTYGVYKKVEPTYDELKKRVAGIINGTETPGASFTPGK